MKKLVVILAAALLVTGIVAAQLWLQLRAAREQNSTLQARMSALEARQLAFRPTMPVAPAPAAGIAGAQPSDAAASPQARPAARERAAAMAQGVRQMMASPEIREMTRVALRQRLPMQYPDIGKELHLSPEEVDKLFDLLAKQQSDQLDAARDSAEARRAGTSAQELQSRTQEQRKAGEAELAAMLGSKYPQYQSYQETLPTRRQVDQLQTMLGSGASPLSDAQAKPLIAAIAAEQARIKQDSPNVAMTPGSNPQEFMQQRLAQTAETNRRLVDVASAHLNSQQLNSYKQMLDQQQGINRLLMRTMGGQGPAQGQTLNPPGP